MLLSLMLVLHSLLLMLVLDWWRATTSGGHLTLYVRPGYAASGARYQPPDLAKALQIKGQPANITFLPPSEGIKILNGAENNDMETGVCYYIALMPDANGKQVANDLKSSVGLEVNLRQDLHLTIAGAAPAWQKVHPKSQAYRDATEEEQKTMNLKEDFQVFRKGVGSFAGFNAEVVTGWNTYAAAIAAISQETAHINYTVAQLEKQKVELDEKIAELNSKKKIQGQNLDLQRVSVTAKPRSSKARCQMLHSRRASWLSLPTSARMDAIKSLTHPN